MRHMSANRQWKVVDECDSGNIFANDHWYSTHISRIVRVKTMQKLRKLRKTAQYCVNSYAKPSFELLKTWNRVKRRSGEHRRTTTEVPRQTKWWNAQIAHVLCQTRILCVIHASTRLLGCVTTTLAAGLLMQFSMLCVCYMQFLKSERDPCMMFAGYNYNQCSLTSLSSSLPSPPKTSGVVAYTQVCCIAWTMQ